MKIIRSTKCSLKFATKSKKEQLQKVLSEYGKVVNVFIDYFWKHGIINKKELLKPIIDIPETWLSARLRKVAAREALDMVKSVQEVFGSNKKQLSLSIAAIKSRIKKIKPETRDDRRKINNLYCKLKRKQNKLSMMQPHKPNHSSKRMNISCTIAELQDSKTNEFDAWLHLASIGNKIIIDIPIRFHKHFNELKNKGERLNSYIITKNDVQFCFEIETGEKKDIKKVIGIDSGINALASLSNGEQLGKDIKSNIARIKRCKFRSKGQTKARNALKQRISEVAKEAISKADLIVVEKLKNLNNNSKLKGRLSRNVRSSIGSWNYSYWMTKLKQKCEDNRVSFRTVSPSYTSQLCPECGHINRMNRNEEIFQCQNCGHFGNADIIAACNIKERFITGRYGSCCKPEKSTCSFL